MDADKLNRELQIFRNHVKIARENIIHKLVRDIKFWKQKQTSDAANVRASKKVRSAELLMAHIRAQPASELAKAVIRFKPKAVAGADRQTVEQRALLRFHENKKLAPEVQALIRRFGLNSKMELLDKFLKSRDQVKVKEGKGKGKKRKEKGKKTRKGNEEAAGEQDSEDQGFCEQDEKVASKEDSSEESNDEGGSVSDEEEPEEVGKFVRTPAKLKTANKKEKKPKDSVKKPETKKRKLLKAPEDDDDADKSVQIQDSFFVTSSGQSYVATAPVVDKKEQGEEEEEYSWKRTIKKKDILGNKEERPQKRPHAKDQDDLHPSWKAKQQQKGIKPFQGQRKRFDEGGDDSAPDLHPSWAAKQRQQGIKPFSGKKMVFDSEQAEPAVAPEDLHPSWAAKQKQKGIKPFAGKKIVFDSETPQQVAPREDLHPSWAAKQKQKGIQAFQGKKTVFESSAPPAAASQPPVPTDLHPSWAAKQREKGIQAFQGKKITFDD